MAAPWLGLDRPTVERGLTALRCSKQEVRWAADLAERWLRLEPGAARRPGRRGRRARRGAPPLGGRHRTHPRAGRHARGGRPVRRGAGGRRAAAAAAAVRAAYRRLVRVAYRDPIELADLAGGGNDLADAGVPAGRSWARSCGSCSTRGRRPARNTGAWLLAEARRLADDARRAPAAPPA
jgi:hypothetical protein